MSETWIGAPLTFWWSEDCDERNEWCNYREPHEHGFACDKECPCKDQDRWRRDCVVCHRILSPARAALGLTVCSGACSKKRAEAST